MSPCASPREQATPKHKPPFPALLPRQQHNFKGMHTKGRLGQSADKVASCSAGGGTELLSCAVGAVVVTEQSSSGHGTEQ